MPTDNDTVYAFDLDTASVRPFSLKSATPTVHAFDLEIVSAIRNENRRFDMNYFYKVGKSDSPSANTRPATCKTARCMAVHVVALRRKLAASLMKASPGTYTEELWSTEKSAYVRSPNYSTLAREIYRIETGKTCRLDFWARNFHFRASRKEAAEHILGTSDVWPQLSDWQVDAYC
jgi:hypothetical protein